MRSEIAAHDALIVVDVQNDFIDGSVSIDDAVAIVPVINRMARQFRHVVFTQDWHPAEHVSFASAHVGMRPGDMVEVAYGLQRLYADHCVQGTAGAELHPGLEIPVHAGRLLKGTRADVDSFSAFVENDGKTSTGLEQRLHSLGVKRLIVAGLALYGCVRHTALDGRRAGFEVVIVDDACRGRASPDNPIFSLALAQAGVVRTRSSAFAGARAAQV